MTMDQKLKISVNPALLTSGPIVRPGDNVISTQKNLLTFKRCFEEMFEYDNIIIIPQNSGDMNSVTIKIKTEIVEQLLNLFSGRDLTGYEHLSNFVACLKEYMTRISGTSVRNINPALGNSNSFVALTRKIVGMVDEAYQDVINMEDDLITTKVEADMLLKPACAEGMDSLLEDEYVDLVHKKCNINTNTIISDLKTKLPTEFGFSPPHDNNRFMSTTGKVLVGGSISQRSILELGKLGEMYSDTMINSLGSIGLLIAFVPVSAMRDIFISADELEQLYPDKSLIEQGWTAGTTLSKSTITNATVQASLKALFSDKEKVKKLVMHNLNEHSAHLIFGASTDDTNKNLAHVLNDDQTAKYTALTAAKDDTTLRLGISNASADILNEDWTALAQWKTEFSSVLLTTKQVKGIMDTLKKVWTRVSDFVVDNKEIVKLGVSAAYSKFGGKLKSKYGVDADHINSFIFEGPTGLVGRNDWPLLAQQLSVSVLPGLGEYISKGPLTQVFSSNILHDKYERFLSKCKNQLRTGTQADNTLTRKYTLDRVVTYDPQIENITSRKTRNIHMI
ncbi:major outer capsid protein [Nilaparvata lugens reovirus]|uniref:Major outer capsid protein n=1 Tax=Nilaparvata lugens reovirus TaxID=33724 RepID=Q83867_9REOV|nr:major outer capsid protein [Nilaparvata lugens reovirus]UHR49954.1 MAG: capsid protein [Nilaparvata lugens reovirus]BAA05123.1 major outer capsid protein [Nilaparvata lugens reovirus]